MKSRQIVGTMTPLPKVGDILHYVYLFTHEQQTGRDEGVKTRPVMVIATQGQRVFTVAITTKADRQPQPWQYPIR